MDFAGSGHIGGGFQREDNDNIGGTDHWTIRKVHGLQQKKGKCISQRC